MRYRYALNLQNTFTDLEEFKQNQRAKNKGRRNYDYFQDAHCTS